MADVGCRLLRERNPLLPAGIPPMAGFIRELQLVSMAMGEGPRPSLF